MNDPLLLRNRRREPVMAARCDLCVGLGPDDLPRPYGFEGFVEGDPFNIVATERTGCRTFKICRDCYRRGGRWQASRIGDLGETR